MIIFILILLNIVIVAVFIFYYTKTKDSRQEINILNNQLNLAKNKLKEIDQDKREFIDVVTHELNTPLATTAGYLSMITELPEDQINPTVLKLAKKSFDATKRMSKIVKDLIDSSQTIGESKVQAIQIEELLEKIVADFSELAKEHNVELIVRPPKKIPLPLVITDPLSTRIIISNLIDNAIKFTKKGEVAVQADLDKGKMLVKVSDTGAGINKEDQKRIFDKFYQADSSRTREAGGTGVGLFIVKSLVEKQGGAIWVESKEGEGSTFYFTLPIAS